MNPNDASSLQKLADIFHAAPISTYAFATSVDVITIDSPVQWNTL